MYIHCVYTYLYNYVYIHCTPSYIEQMPRAGDEIVVSIGPFESDIACTSVHQEHDTLKYATVHKKSQCTCTYKQV